MKYRPTAAEAALLLIHLCNAYDDEKAKHTTRFRVSSATLRRVSGRHALRGSFVDDLENEIADLKWSSFWVANNLALIRTDTVDSWPRIASKWIADVLKRVEKGDTEVLAKIEAQLQPTTDIDEADGEEPKNDNTGGKHASHDLV